MPRNMKIIVFNFDELSEKTTETMPRALNGEPASKAKEG